MEEKERIAEWSPSDLKLIQWFTEKGHEAIHIKPFKLYPWLTIINPEKWKARLKEAITMGPEAEEAFYVNLTKDLRKLKFLLEKGMPLNQDDQHEPTVSTGRFINGTNSSTNANIQSLNKRPAGNPVDPKTIF
jgi:hypothetical protein